MKAVRLYEYGGPENLRYEGNVPEPTLANDCVLVEAAATSVNPSIGKYARGRGKRISH